MTSKRVQTYFQGTFEGIERGKRKNKSLPSYDAPPPLHFHLPTQNHNDEWMRSMNTAVSVLAHWCVFQSIVENILEVLSLVKNSLYVDW
jgi:hypothetical protein